MSNTFSAEKLAKLQATERLGGKGTPRRKVKKSTKSSASSSAAYIENDKKIATALKKVNAQMIPGLEEVNLFKQDGNIIHIARPSVQASVPCNTFCVTGHAEEKSLEEMLPGILNQLGSDSIANLRRIAESFKPSGSGMSHSDAAEDDEVPELIGNFDAKVTV